MSQTQGEGLPCEEEKTVFVPSQRPCRNEKEKSCGVRNDGSNLQLKPFTQDDGVHRIHQRQASA